MTSVLQPEDNFIVIDAQGNVVDLQDEAGPGTTSATEDFLGQLSLSALQGTDHERGPQCTMGQNQVILRHQRCERTGEWPSTYVSILVCSRP